MAYTQQQLNDFWFGTGGSANDIRANAFVTMQNNQIVQLTTPGNPSYDASFDAILGYIFANKLFGYANYVPGAAGNMSYQGRVTSK